jgi:hypothetical protein
MEKYEGFDLEIIMIGEQDVVCTSPYCDVETPPIPITPGEPKEDA